MVVVTEWKALFTLTNCSDTIQPTLITPLNPIFQILLFKWPTNETARHLMLPLKHQSN